MPEALDDRQIVFHGANDVADDDCSWISLEPNATAPPLRRSYETGPHHPLNDFVKVIARHVVSLGDLRHGPASLPSDTKKEQDSKSVVGMESQFHEDT